MMAKEMVAKRLTVSADHDVVVFLIGASVEKWWRFWDWIPVGLAMARMMKELESKPEAGLLAHRGSGIQYWKSLEHLLAYASDRDGEHYPAWAKFYRTAARSEAVGIWHETYAVPKENIEALYFGGPRRGLGTIFELIPATGNRKSARKRLRELTEQPARKAA